MAKSFQSAAVVKGGGGVCGKTGVGQMSTMDVGEEEGLMSVGGRKPARVQRDPSLPLKVMSDTLAIEDDHPLALELQSLRATVARYQVLVVFSFAS